VTGPSSDREAFRNRSDLGGCALDIRDERPGWVESPRLVCLGFDWSLRADDPTLVRDVTRLYEGCIAPGRAQHRFTLGRRAGSGSANVNLALDNDLVLRDVPLGLAVAHLVWAVNRGVVEETSNRLLLHAAAAERDGEVVVLAGPRGAGKSTLVAALVRAGFRYVTDETVAVEPSTLTIEPYPKPVALDHGSEALLPDLHPEFESAPGTTAQRLVSPRGIRSDAVASSGGVPSIVILPSHRPTHATAAHPITRAEAAVALATHSFNFSSFGPGALGVVAAVVRRSRCYRLDVGTLDSACRLVTDLLRPAMVAR